MKGIYLTLQEIEATHGVGPLSSCAYLWLRYWVDIRTGVVGKSRPISLGMLRAYCETHVPKGRGIQIVQPSERNIRTALEVLERVGLIKRLPGDNLIFRLPLAQVLLLAPGKPDVNLTGYPDTMPGRVDNWAEAATGAGAPNVVQPNPARYPSRPRTAYPTHIRGRRDNPPSQPAASTTREERMLAAGRNERHEAIAALLHDQGVLVGSGHPVVAEWVAMNVSDTDLLAAVQLACQAREAEGTGQPLNPGFIRAKLRKVLGKEKPAAVAWWSSVPAMEARARELKIAGARPGESMEEFKARIVVAGCQPTTSAR